MKKTSKTIRILMIKHDVTMGSIAEALEISQQGVWNRLSGRIASKRIDAEIARVTGKLPKVITEIINRETRSKEAAENGSAN